MSNIVISQPMYFPWIGLFEQLLLADTFIFLDDVQYAKGFINRVQYKTAAGSKWMTVPLQKHGQKTKICELKSSTDKDWREEHRKKLESSLTKAPYVNEALQLYSAVVDQRDLSFSDLIIDSVMAVVAYFDLGGDVKFLKSSALPVSASKGELIKELVLNQGGSHYITGMGGLNYLDHEDFEINGINVSYMNYKKQPYLQAHGEFTPYVTVLDLIAHCGVDGRKYMCPETIDWRQAKSNER